MEAEKLVLGSRGRGGASGGKGMDARAIDLIWFGTGGLVGPGGAHLDIKRYSNTE